ncbi:MAG: ABC transporter permease subunit [Myxococcales bacterium]|nr:ABC transporter permease subunit [Myxococcales bacterium]
MRNVFAIVRKELLQYFTTSVAYWVFAVFSLVTSFFFIRILTFFQRSIMLNSQMRPQMLQYMNFTDQVLAPLFYNAAVILIFVAPFLTMRLIAEERRARTFDLLLTNPVTPFQIALGKYLASLVVLLVMVLLTLVYPLLVSAYAEVGAVAWSTVFTGLLGIFLLGASFTAIGMFVSSLTQSQVVAAFLTFLVLLLLWVVGWAGADNAGLAREILTGLSAIEHIRGFAKGVIDLKDLAYYASLIGLGLFFTHRSIETLRWR